MKKTILDDATYGVDIVHVADVEYARLVSGLSGSGALSVEELETIAGVVVGSKALVQHRTYMPEEGTR
ncbi:hypothetical protein QEV67_02810 [Trueperella pyogenes]|uniref:hypothetical protein n=1 Tax=Trueperella pyogenes TaxID=1661 RepID=UPI0004683C02|nr:hypothetical protein [Trueperella pyogenes]